jgi:Mitochondrial glycoprotein
MYRSVTIASRAISNCHSLLAPQRALSSTSTSSPIVALSRPARLALQLSKECVALRRKIDRSHAKVIEKRLSLMRERGFSVVDVPGMVTVELQRSYMDEQITVEFETQSLSENDDTFKIFDVIVRSQRCKERYLVVSCTFHPQYRQLSVRMVGINDRPTAQHVYDGPHLFNLNESTQKGIEAYLSDRGIDDKLVEFILYYNVHKEARETVHALEALSDHLKIDMAT